MGNTTSENCGPESSNSSVLEGSAESLNFKMLLSTLDPSGASVFQNALSSTDLLSVHQENLQETSPSNASPLAEKTKCPQMPKDDKVVWYLLYIP